MDEVEELPPGWYRQQTDPSMLRWWDGHDWTDDVLVVSEGDLERDPDPPESQRSAAASSAAEADRPKRSQPARRGREKLRPTPGPRGSGAAPEGDLRIRIQEDAGEPPVSGAMRPRPGPTRRSAPPPDPRRGGATGPEPRPLGARPGPGATQRPRPSGVGAALGTRRPTTGARPGRYTPPPAARPHLGRFAVRVVMVAGVAALGYLLIKPFFDPPEEAQTVADRVAPTTTIAEDGSFADGSAPLSDAVLGLSELPTGWSTQAELPGPRLGFCGGRNPLQAIIPAEELQATFSRAAEGPFLSNVSLRFTNVDEAELFMDLVARTLETCHTYQQDGATFLLEPSDFPKLGDETFAAHLVVGDSILEGDVVWVRHGARVFNLSGVAFGEFDVDLIELLAERLARRL